MNRDMKSTLGMATAAAALIAAAAIASGDALADEITGASATSPSAMSPAKARTGAIKRSDLPTYGPTEWTLNQHEPLGASSYTPRQAQADYTANREAVRALTAEDSGSSYTWKLPPEPGTNLMGGPAR